MKKILIICGLMAFNQAIAADTYTLDPDHSYVLYDINHLGFSTQSGKWKNVNGTISLDEQNPAKSKVDVTIKVGDDLVTGNPELDKHLKGEQFFEVAKYPIATFVSDGVITSNNKTAQVHGILTLHGVSKPVTLDAVFNKKAPNIITNKMTVGFSAKAKLKRSDFGMTTLIPALGDDVTLDIDVEAYKA